MKDESIEKYMLPVKTIVQYLWNRETRKNERVCYLECSNGEVLTVNIPFSWMSFMAFNLNRKYYNEISKGFRVSDPIAILKIPGLPMQRSDSQIVGKNKKGEVCILENPAYTESIKKAELLGEGLFEQRWVQLPIREPVCATCIYNIRGSEQYDLSQCNCWVVDLLDRLGILYSKLHRVVVSTNGSRFRTVKSEECIIIVIRRVEGGKQ